ncbi:MAG TPA: hypothetical protein VEZ14_02335 [Dehalococcoidia bacterium]|nr:hypothetical protein [Dehalococcoidia bacterium]
MTIVFDDEELYTALKVAAAKSHRPAKDLVAEALTLLFEATGEEQHAIMMRSQTKGLSRDGGAGVEQVLRELGLARDEAAARR